MRKLLVTVAALTAIAGAANASGFSDNFNSEAGGNSSLNYTGFANWNVTSGSVDVVKTGDFGIVCAGGSGSCVDLDGSTSQGGIIQTNSYAFGAGDTVKLSWELSGAQRGVTASDGFLAGFTFGSATSVSDYTLGGAYGNFNFGGFTTTGTVTTTNIGGATPFQLYSLSFKALSAGTLTARIGDAFPNNNDNVGPILDNVNLSITNAVPEPAAWTMMIVGFGMAGAALRRRKALLTAA